MEIDPVDQAVRLRVYELLLETGQVPKVARISESMRRSEDDVRGSLERLYVAKALPESREVLMASPWSAVPTSFSVEAGGRAVTSCACCGESMEVEVEGGRLLSGAGLLHISVPARHWWDEIFFT